MLIGLNVINANLIKKHRVNEVDLCSQHKKQQ